MNSLVSYVNNEYFLYRSIQSRALCLHLLWLQELGVSACSCIIEQTPVIWSYSESPSIPVPGFACSLLEPLGVQLGDQPPRSYPAPEFLDKSHPLTMPLWWILPASCSLTDAWGHALLLKGSHCSSTWVVWGEFFPFEGHVSPPLKWEWY